MKSAGQNHNAQLRAGHATAMRPDVPRAARIAQRVGENSKTVSLVLEASMTAQCGQFAMLWLPGMDEKPFSIAASDPLMFTIARVGPFSEALHDLGPGDRIWYRGPFGRGFTTAHGGSLLVGGGYGAAPLHFLAREILASSNPAANERAPDVRPIIVIGARSAADLLFIDRFKELGLEVHATTEDGSSGAKGLVTEAVKPLLDSGRVRRLYSCGPEAMLEALASLCIQAGVEAELSHEAYMRCGIGICGACEHGGRLVCMDGPVFTVPPRT